MGKKKNKKKSIENDINEDDNNNENELLFKLFGIKEFKSTKNESHIDSDLSGVFFGKNIQREYTQYLNRKGNKYLRLKDKQIQKEIENKRKEWEERKKKRRTR